MSKPASVNPAFEKSRIGNRINQKPCQSKKATSSPVDAGRGASHAGCFRFRDSGKGI
jgi:hypothetical protein